MGFNPVEGVDTRGVGEGVVSVLLFSLLEGHR